MTTRIITTEEIMAEHTDSHHLRSYRVDITPMYGWTTTRVAGICDITKKDKSTPAKAGFGVGGYLFRIGGNMGNFDEALQPNPDYDLPLLTKAFETLPNSVAITNISWQVIFIQHKRRDSLRALKFARNLVRGTVLSDPNNTLKIRWFGNPHTPGYRPHLGFGR